MAVRIRVTALTVVLLAAVSSASDLPYALDPEGEAERALAEVAARSAFGNTDTRVAALQAVSAAHPATAASGVAAIEAGRLLLADDRAGEAVAALRHADIARTALRDHALFALGRALEGTRDPAAAAQAYVAAAEAQAHGPLACLALLSAGQALLEAGRADQALMPLQRALDACPDRTPALLDVVARAHEMRNEHRAAAEALERIEREFPASDEALAARRTLAQLSAFRPQLGPEERLLRTLSQVDALVQAGRARDALAILSPMATPRGALAPACALTRARVFAALGRRRDAEKALATVPDTAEQAAEAALMAARLRARATGAIDGYEDVIRRFPGTPSAQQALLALANHYQKDANAEAALPYYRQFLDAVPDGDVARTVAYRVGWGDYRLGRYEAAAETLERAARRWPAARETPGLLYWAGRAHAAAGHPERAAALFAETARRYKHAYHGMLAAEDLARLPALPVAVAPVLPDDPGTQGSLATPADLPEPTRTRVRQLLLVNRFDDAIDDLVSVPASLAAKVTIGWIEYRRGRLRPAIVALKRAYPWHVSEAGDQLPQEIWRMLYPLEHADILAAKAREANLDPALVAGLICQESTFASDALSPAGARGLMQIMPATGRALARELGLRVATRDLYEPTVSLGLGTHYLARMIEHFGGRVERALAAYNAGPHRVERWIADRPDMPADEFIESIPFSETRHYVAVVLANQAHYRRLYALAPGAQTARSEP